MDTSSGLSSIASLSLGFTMSMRAGGMAFAANRGGGTGSPLMPGPCPWAAGIASGWKSPSNASTSDPAAPGGTSPRRQGGDSKAADDGESCRSLVVPCVSLITAPLASNDRQTEDSNPPQTTTIHIPDRRLLADQNPRPQTSSPHRLMSPIVEV